MPKKKTNVDAPAVEPAPEVIATETTVNEDASDARIGAPLTDAPTSKHKKAKKPKGDPNLTLEDLAARYLQHLEDEGKSTGTTFSYRLELILAMDELGKDTKVVDLTPAKVLDFYACDRVTKTRTGRMKAKPSIDKTRRVLRLALCFAETAGLIEKAPLPEDAATY